MWMHQKPGESGPGTYKFSPTLLLSVIGNPLADRRGGLTKLGQTGFKGDGRCIEFVF